MSFYKQYRVIEIRTDTLGETGQEVMVASLSEVMFKDETKYKYNVVGGEDYIIDADNSLCSEIFKKAQDEDVLEIDYNDFSFEFIRNEYNVERVIYFHKSIKKYYNK